MAIEWSVGDKICKRWEIQTIVGAGGFGVVYLVWDHVTKEALAAKTLKGPLLNQEAALERFEAECNVWISMEHHVNVVPALLVRRYAGRPFLLMGYAEGGSLESCIGTEKLVDNPSTIVGFAMQICDGMSHALANGLKAHRDLKPSNILLTEGNVLQVTDFGLAKATGVPAIVSSPHLLPPHGSGRASAGGTQSAVAMGSLAYMAPEQYQDAKSVDHRADIYSFGVTLFQMVSGRLPFVADSVEGFAWQHLRAKPPSLRPYAGPAWPREVVKRLDALVKDCLSKSPSKRPQHFSAIRTELGAQFKMLTGNIPHAPPRPRPPSPSTLAYRGEGLAAVRNYHGALECFSRALKMEPENANTMKSLGTCYGEMGEFKRELECYDKAVALMPSNSTLWANRSAALRCLGELEDSLASAEQAIILDRTNDFAWYAKALVFARLDNLPSARDCLFEATRLDPGNDDYMYKLAQVLGHLGAKAAEEMYRFTLQLNERRVDAWYDLGVLVGRQGRFEDEVECYENAVRLDANHEQAWCNLGTALLSLGRASEARPCFDAALALEASDGLAWMGKGEARRLLGLLDETTAQCYRQALGLGRPEARDRLRELHSRGLHPA